jgi:hypothetical protein
MTRLGALTLAVLVGLVASPLAATDGMTLAAAVSPCLAPHGQRDQYQADLSTQGWLPLPDDQRAAGLAMIADTYLPLTGGQIDAPWAAHVGGRAAAREFWADLAGTRLMMWRDGVVLLLAGFRDDDGSLRVECWTAGPETPATDDAFALIGQVWDSEGVRLTQLELAPQGDGPKTSVLMIRVTPPTPTDPPLAATDGLRTRIVLTQKEVAL